MDIILNEKEYAENCLAKGYVSSKPYNDLTILAKYYYHNYNYRKKMITKLLLSFLEQNYSRFFASKNTWIDTVEKIAKNAGKKPLYENDGVWITENELSVINGLENIKLKKIAFSFLCLAKFNNLRNPKNNNWVSNDLKDIFQTARVQCSVMKRAEIRGDLQLLGLIEFPKKNGNLSSRVTFVSTNDNDRKVLHITDFRELGYAYLKYIGEDYIECASCGILINHGKTKSRKYCANCLKTDVGGTKTISCLKCGKQFEVSKKNHKTNMCSSCYEKYRIDYMNIYYIENHRKKIRK